MPSQTANQLVRDDPLESGEHILKSLADRNLNEIYAAVSGGDDSTVALHFAHNSPHIELSGILHLKTGIGVPQTTEFVEKQAEKLGIPCYVLGDENCRRENETYRYLVTKFGFPGANPIAHSQMQNNLKSKMFSRFVNSIEGDVGLISGVRKSESKRRYQKLTELADEGIQEIGGIIWASPLAEFDEPDLAAYKDARDIEENPVAAILNSSGECLCAYEARERIKTLQEFFPQTANYIQQLEWEVIEQVARAAVQKKYALWGHGSVDSGEYRARVDSSQGSLLCADCEDTCGETGYTPSGNNPLTPAEKFMQETDLETEYWNWPFFCVPCCRVIKSPLRHRNECHPWDAETGLEGYWDMRLVDVHASAGRDFIITEPNGYNMHVNEMAATKEEAAKYKHHGYYENYRLRHCPHHEHDWAPFNGGPVKQCTRCFAFDLSEYDPSEPGPPILAPAEVAEDTLTPTREETEEVQMTLGEIAKTGKGSVALPSNAPI